MLRYAFAAVLFSAATLPAQFGGVSTFFTQTNDAADNQIQVGVSFFGRVFPFRRFSTGGQGTGAGLGSQSALAQSSHYLVAVNAGSNDITLFRRWSVFLFRRDVESTGGTRPTSVTIRGNLVYALNAGSDNLTGFRIWHGALHAIGKFALSGAKVGAAQVGFDPTGRHVVVTEKATNQILVYPVNKDGTLGKPTVNKSAAQTPFGFVFRRDGTLVVSEAVGGQSGKSKVSSYEIRGNGTLRTISGAVATKQTAACWIAIPRNGRFAYSTNTGSASITGFRVDGKGALTLLDASGVTGKLRDGARPIDADFNTRGRLLFVLDSEHDEIVSFYRDHRGGLHLLHGSVQLPDGAAGLIAR